MKPWLLAVVAASALILACENPTTEAPPPSLDYESDTIGVLTYVPAGSFQYSANPANKAVITEPFRIGQHEITRAQYQAVMGIDPSNTGVSLGTSDPVQMVNWYRAIAFCNKLSVAEGLSRVYDVAGFDDDAAWSDLAHADIPVANDADWNAATATWTNSGYRLPTEFEWMWAAMGAPAEGQDGGVSTTGYAKGYAGSAEGAGQTQLGAYAWYVGNSEDTTHPVGEKLANELGLFDMAGNVWEWCWDSYGAWPGGTLEDYRGAAPGTQRIKLGGSAQSDGSYCPIAYHYFDTISLIDFKNGFRVVRR